MKKSITLSAFTASMLASFAAQAADTAELSVKGVIRPTACTASLSNAGVVDYGTIPANSLSMGAYTRLGKKSIPFVIVCNAATKIAFKASDNRASSVISGIVNLAPDSHLFGLGTVASKKVGSYMLYFPESSVTTDDFRASQIVSTDGHKTWFPVGTDSNSMLGNERTLSWAAPNGTIPMSFKTIRGNIDVYAFLNKSENLPLTQDVPLDGSATLEIIYL